MGDGCHALELLCSRCSGLVALLSRPFASFEVKSACEGSHFEVDPRRHCQRWSVVFQRKVLNGACSYRACGICCFLFSVFRIQSLSGPGGRKHCICPPPKKEKK